jgi:trans-2,3-dihydro-3-hydroxyanthranilate isomerase
MRFSIVDVFAEQRYQGNQLAVVRDAGGLDAATMQTIAREMNFSETTFVVAEDQGRATVRIFTPGEELPFAGHPTLGTAWVLAAGSAEYTLQLGVGPISVTFADGIASFTPPLAEFGATLEPEVAAALTGLDARDLDLSLPPRLVRCGPWFPIVAVRDLDALRRIRVDRETQARLAMPDYAFVVCRGGYDRDADFAARMIFFDGTSLREDPATGSANAAFAQYLQRLGERRRRIVEQGFEMRRPSRIYLELREESASPDVAPVTVGGKVQPVAAGELR